VRSGYDRLDDGDAAAALPELEEADAMAERILTPEDPLRVSCRTSVEKCRKALEAAAGGK
jgi:hypothetical protein